MTPTPQEAQVETWLRWDADIEGWGYLAINFGETWGWFRVAMPETAGKRIIADHTAAVHAERMAEVCVIERTDAVGNKRWTCRLCEATGYKTTEVWHWPDCPVLAYRTVQGKEQAGE